MEDRTIIGEGGIGMLQSATRSTFRAGIFAGQKYLEGSVVTGSFLFTSMSPDRVLTHNTGSAIAILLQLQFIKLASSQVTFS